MDIIDALRLTDVDENNYSSQLKCIEGESDTNEFDDNYEWTFSNFVLSKKKDMDIEIPTIQNAILAGAILETLYYVSVNMSSSADFYLSIFEQLTEIEGYKECVILNTEGVIFDVESDAENFSRFMDSVEWIC